MLPATIADISCSYAACYHNRHFLLPCCAFAGIPPKGAACPIRCASLRTAYKKPLGLPLRILSLALAIQHGNPIFWEKLIHQLVLLGWLALQAVSSHPPYLFRLGLGRGVFCCLLDGGFYRFAYQFPILGVCFCKLCNLLVCLGYDYLLFFFG